MNNSRQGPPTLCVLTQTASEVRPYYREFFAGLDLFFVTYKEENPEAVDFLPGSTWSDGRNRLWEHVKDRYDYYLFIDDDLEFFYLPTDLPTTVGRLLQAKPHLQTKLRMRRLTTRLLHWFSYQKAEPARFRELLFAKLETYRPMVASVALTVDGTNAFHTLDRYALNRSRRVRPQGWFDAQVTLFSNIGASLLLPYDTHISGWWSSQIPIYMLAHLAFKDRAINILDIASRNMSTSLYRPGYDGIQDCLLMSEWLSPGILDPRCDPINLKDGSFIDQDFAHEFAKKKAEPNPRGEQTLAAALTALGKSFDLHHPYIYERHQALVDTLSGRSPGPSRKSVHG